MELTLKRFGSIPDQGTFGELVAGEFTCATIECPWLDNRASVSCVPAGRYTLVPHSSRAHPNTWALESRELGVSHYAAPWAQRYAILIHPGNYVQDFNGCIGPGRARSGNGGRWMVTHSRDTFDQLIQFLSEENQHILNIEWICLES